MLIGLQFNQCFQRKYNARDCRRCWFSRGSWCRLPSDVKIFNKISRVFAERSYIRGGDFGIMSFFDRKISVFVWKKINFVKKKSLKNALFWNHLFSIEGITDFVSFKKFSFRSQNLGSKLAQALNDDISKLKFQIWESVIYLEMSKSRIRNSEKIENYWLQFSDFLQKVWLRISTFKWENVTF